MSSGHSLLMWKTFHHPDISVPVVRRRVSIELLEMLDILGDAAVHGAWAFMRNHRDRDREGYLRAVQRLAKQGLVVKHRGLDTPILQISEAGSDSLAAYFQPEKYWERKWSGVWYMLVYDIPEVDRKYRDMLRKFLKSQRMGCFQKSIWISARDIRPQYADLARGAALDAFACLFEARTVLGMHAEQVVSEAWDFEELYVLQKRFCDVYSENLKLLQVHAKEMTTEKLVRLATEELEAYRMAFVWDPLLPSKLLPYSYQGKAAHALHLELSNLVRIQLKICNLKSRS